MRVAILQPSYLPWLGYFEQMHFADTFVFLNDVQYTKNDWRNRNRIKTLKGAAWITVPVRRLSSIQKISETLVDYTHDWVVDHINLLTFNYKNAPYFEAVMEVILPHLKDRYEKLEDLNINLTLDLAHLMRLDRQIVKSSDLEIASTDPNGRLVDICHKLGATEFYEGASGQSYLNHELFRQNGVEIIFQDYKHPVTRQFHEPFVSHLSIVDLLFHHGPESLDLLTSGH